MTNIDISRTKVFALTVAVLVIVGVGSTVVFAQEQSDEAGNAEAGAMTVTAEDVEAEEVRVENVTVSNLTVNLSGMNDTQSFMQNPLESALGDNVEGFEADSIEIGNVSQANIEIEDNRATIDAEIDSITLEGVQVDRVTMNGSQMDNMSQPMLSDGNLSFESFSIEGLSVGSLTTEQAAAAPEEPTDNVTAENVTVGDNVTDENVTDENVTDGEAVFGDNETAADESSVTFEDQTSNGSVVTVDSVSLPEGGYVAIHNSSLNEGEVIRSVVGTSEHLEAGTHEDVNVTLFNVSGVNYSQDELSESQMLIAMPHQETNDNETYDFVATGGEADGPYTVDDAPVVDDGNVTVEG